MTTAQSRPVRALMNKISNELRERREARAAYRTLERELASYRTPHEVDDLLGSISGQDGPEADQIREILLDNLRPSPTLYRAA